MAPFVYVPPTDDVLHHRTGTLVSVARCIPPRSVMSPRATSIVKIYVLMNLFHRMLSPDGRCRFDRELVLLRHSSVMDLLSLAQCSAETKERKSVEIRFPADTMWVPLFPLHAQPNAPVTLLHEVPMTDSFLRSLQSECSLPTCSLQT